MTPPRVEFYRHHLGEPEIKAATSVLQSVFLTTGPRAREFELAFASFLRVRHVVTVSSCTDALMIALAALEIGPGDEVITTPMTFIATANAILHVGARPVFADVDPVTGNLDPEAVRRAITPRTRAILPVHLYGEMADMTALGAIADEHRLALIEDAAHCVEGSRRGVGPGQIGDAACFSFYATKNLTSGEGGAIATESDALAARFRELRQHGMNREAADRYHDRAYKHWDMLSLGYKANLSDVNAALLLPQLPGVAARLERREAIARRYEAAFFGLPGISFPRTHPEGKSARHLFTLWITEPLRDQFLADMSEAGIGVAVNYRAVHLLSYYRRHLEFSEGMFPVAESIGRRTATIPLYPKLTDEEVSRVIEAVTAWAEKNRAALTAR